MDLLGKLTNDTYISNALGIDTQTNTLKGGMRICEICGPAVVGTRTGSTRKPRYWCSKKMNEKSLFVPLFARARMVVDEGNYNAKKGRKFIREAIMTYLDT